MNRVGSRCLIAVASSFICFGLLFECNVFAADQTPCSNDIAKFCKGVNPSRRAVMSCLEQHEAQLSDACKEYEAKTERARVEAREAKMQQLRFRQACKDDMVKFCNNAAAKQSGPIKCLKGHAGELSAPCNESIKAMEEDKE